MAVTCVGCGASDPDGTLACSLCHRPRDLVTAEATPANATTVGTNGFLVSAPRPTARLDEREFSRVKASSTSFGLRGRLVMSGLLLIPCLGAWFMMGGAEARSFTAICISVLSILPMLFLPAFFIRDAWRSHRVK